MELTGCQDRAMAMVGRLIEKDGYAMAVLAGYAGTGKTTMLRQIADRFGVPRVIAPTGKAAARVKEATGIGASTIHRWLYKYTHDDRTGEGHFSLKVPDELGAEAKMLVVEEASMVSRDVWNDIEETARMLGLKVLCVGDPFQLPPVDEDSADFCLLDPDQGLASEYVLLDEVVRQALDSPVIRASMLVRNGDIVGAMGVLPKVSPLQAVDAAARCNAAGGAIICHKNDTRFALNEKIRKMRGYEGTLQPGEPLMIIKNNYQLFVYNGEIYPLLAWEDVTNAKHKVHDKWKKITEETRFGQATLQYDEQMTFKAVLAEEEAFGRLKVNGLAMERTGDILFTKEPYIHANLGYALTAHKSQGSEWNDVLVILEPTIRFWGDNRTQALRWAYTAITRAKKNCTLALGIRL